MGQELRTWQHPDVGLHAGGAPCDVLVACIPCSARWCEQRIPKAYSLLRSHVWVSPHPAAALPLLPHTHTHTHTYTPLAANAFAVYSL